VTLAGIAAVAIVAAACGDDGSASTTASPTTPGSTEPTAPESIPATTMVDAVDPSTAAEWEEAVEAFRAMRPDKMPEHFEQVDAVRTGDEFDVNRFFEALDHLAMEDGWTLDYVYRYNDYAGYPALYAREADQDRYRTETEYLEADRPGYHDHVVVDDTAEGFFQLVVLRWESTQFYLFWHAYNDDDLMLTTADQVAGILDQVGEQMTEEARRAAAEIDPAPVVRVGDEVVEVEVVRFSLAGGFYGHAFSIRREFPHEFVEESSEQLAECECAITY
jgi:hypothetical protein